MTKHQNSIKLLLILLGIVIANFFLSLILPQELYVALIIDFIGVYIISVIKNFILFFTVLYFIYYYIRRTKIHVKNNINLLLYIAKLSAGAELIRELIRLLPYNIFESSIICQLLQYVMPILIVAIYFIETILIFRKSFCSDISLQKLFKSSFFNYQALVSLAVIIILVVITNSLHWFSDSARPIKESLISFFLYLSNGSKYSYIRLLPYYVTVALTSVHLYLSLLHGFEIKRKSLF